jgi:hypothetical protein
MAQEVEDDSGAECLRLLKELDGLEQEQRQLDLRDPLAVDACHRKIEALREQIATLSRRGDAKNASSGAR